ncbi:MAG TPA: hypothetical protein VF101_19350 [Gaiellaceae bacterium]
MEGLFHKTQHLITDDDNNVVGIAVSGPITKWGDQELGATITAKILVNGEVKAEGTTAAELPHGATLWMFAVPVEAGTLAPGPAKGMAEAQIKLADPAQSGSSFKWPTDVTLV